MSKGQERFKNVKDFGKSLGLSDIEMQLIMQKKRLIEKLRKEREKKGLTQAELAELVESKQPAIARMESGQVSEVSMDFLCKVALALGVSVTAKLGLIDIKRYGTGADWERMQGFNLERFRQR